MSSVAVAHLPGGGHEIYTHFNGQRVVLVIVRPVGTLEFGALRSAFSEMWVPELIEALYLARAIARREKPWEPYTDTPVGLMEEHALRLEWHNPDRQIVVTDEADIRVIRRGFSGADVVEVSRWVFGWSANA
ncbi:hypothetical protein [Mycolicibacterium sphagni]|uniref:Uncharacterized protein n=1 Tax=Mycolicibacterium sphagni TaxID=1786 RepID=A0A255DBN5_9MYCO|nr:hypothetical protein [Mycolicibacterium sphagni]OYN76838.1 hypothetical protein CG716_20200 [Mycolicibacterium sphagni]